MPHSYGASFAAVGRFGPSRIDATKLRAANRNTNAISENSGRYWSRATGAGYPRRAGSPQSDRDSRGPVRRPPEYPCRAFGERLLRAAEFTSERPASRIDEQPVIEAPIEPTANPRPVTR